MERRPQRWRRGYKLFFKEVKRTLSPKKRTGLDLENKVPD
jgi:hypothetical protein